MIKKYLYFRERVTKYNMKIQAFLTRRVKDDFYYKFISTLKVNQIFYN